MRVVQALNGHGRCLTMFGHVVEETRRLGSCLEFCSFHHVKWEGNKLAHFLAHREVEVLSTDMMFGWKNYPRTWMLYSKVI